jgi:hypothetical protein
LLATRALVSDAVTNTSPREHLTEIGRYDGSTHAQHMGDATFGRDHSSCDGQLSGSLD